MRTFTSRSSNRRVQETHGHTDTRTRSLVFTDLRILVFRDLRILVFRDLRILVFDTKDLLSHWQLYRVSGDRCPLSEGLSSQKTRWGGQTSQDQIPVPSGDTT